MVLDISKFPKNGDGSKSQCKKCCVERVRIKQKEFTEWSNSLKKACFICGYNKTKIAIDWHHINETEKEFEISRMISSNFPSEKNKLKVLREMEKCVCLCANCHREVHAGIMSIE